jgi:hypothetical protein
LEKDIVGYVGVELAVDLEEVVVGVPRDRRGVATGERGYQIHRRHRYPGTHPVARRRFFALTVPRRHAHKLEPAVRTSKAERDARADDVR